MTTGISITGYVVEDEDLGIITVAADSEAVGVPPDNNVTLTTFQAAITAASSLGTELTTLGIYPSAANAIGIAGNAIVSTTDQNLQFTTSGGGTLSAVDTGFKAISGNEIFLYSDASNPDIVLGREGNGSTAASDGTVAFALVLQPSAGGATIWVLQYEALAQTNPTAGEDANVLNLAGLVSVSGTTTSTSGFVIGTKLPGQNYWLPFNSTSGDPGTVLVTGFDQTASSPDTVNTSSTGDGSNSQAITPGGALRFDFVTTTGYTGGSTKDKTFLTAGSPGALSISAFTEGTEGSFDISQVSPSNSLVNLQIIAQDEATGSFANDTSLSNPITLGKIDVYDSTGQIASSTWVPSSNHGITFGVTSNVLTGVVNGLTSGQKIDFTVLSGTFNQFVVENVTPGKNTPGFDILNVTQTRTQTSHDIQDVGSHIVFEDSVPTASVNTLTATVDEDALVGETTGETGKTGSASGNVSTLFNAGVDTPLVYTLSGATSGLPTLTSDGAQVTYSITTALGVDTLTAQTASATVFTFALTEATGAFTFTLSAPIDQETSQNGSPEGSFSFTGVSALIQATDKDGSTATAAGNALTLTIIDDQPTFIANMSTSGSVDEDALSALPDSAGKLPTAAGNVSSLFTTGADAPLTFTLSSLTSSLTGLSSHGTLLAYGFSGPTLTATAGLGGATVFTLTLDSGTGAWQFTLGQPIDHPPGASDASATTIDFSSLLQATDADGSIATAPANAWKVTITDDVPADFHPEAITAADNVQDKAGATFSGLLVNTTGTNDPVADANPSLSLVQHAGGDGFGALTFVGVNGSTLSGQVSGGPPQTLQASGSDVFLFGFGTGLLTATTDATGAGLGGAGGAVNTADEVFTIALDPNAGTYAFNMLQPVGNGSSVTFDDFKDVPPNNYAWFSLPFDPAAHQPLSGKSVVFTGKTPGVDTVNPSSTGVGTDKQAVATGGAIRLDFVDDVHSITSTTDLKSLGTLGYADHYQVNNSGFTLSQVNPNGKAVDIRLDAYEVNTPPVALAPGDPFPDETKATQEKVTDVKIVSETTVNGKINTTTLAEFTADGTKSFTYGGISQSITAKFAPSGDLNGVDVQGLRSVAGEFVLVSTASGFDRLVATNIGSAYANKNSFDMGAVSASTSIAGQQVDMGFHLALQDYDAAHSGLNSSLVEAGLGTLNMSLVPTA